MTPKLSLRATARGMLDVFLHRWRFLFAVAALVFLPLSALEALGDGFTELEIEGTDPLLDAEAIGVFAVASFVALLGEQFYAGVAEEATGEWRSGHAPRPLRRLAAELPYGRLLVADVVIAVATVAGLLLLVVPGLLVFTWFSLTAPVITLEDRSVRAALRRSRELVRGSFWRVAGILLVLLIATETATEGLVALAEDALGHGFLVEWLGAAAGNIALAPVYALAVVVIMYELIELKSD